VRQWPFLCYHYSESIKIKLGGKLMAEEKVVTLSPNVCFDTDDNQSGGTLEIALPGVKKEDINLKINADGYNLSAVRGDTRYVANEAFCCPVVPDKTEAKYENGLLVIKLKFKDPMEEAIPVAIQ
jgi:HSP20 family protein